MIAKNSSNFWNFEEFKTEVSLQGRDAVVEMALANTRARLRMTTLYYHAGLLGYLVAGTGNKVEDFGVGLFLTVIYPK